MLTWEALELAGIGVPRHCRVASIAEAQAFARELGNPFYLKADTSLHKTSLGLVIGNLVAGQSLDGAWDRLTVNALEANVGPPFLIQETVPAGLELFVGVVRDAAFGHMIVAGIGGRLVEAIGRRALRTLPISNSTAQAMLEEIDVIGHLQPIAVAAVIDVLVGVSGLIEKHPETQELDLNPVIVSDTHAVVVDLRVVDTVDPPGSRVADRGDASRAIERLMSPASVAVIGASSDPTRPGGRALRYLWSLAPEVHTYPVNHSGGEIDGVPVFESIADLPHGIDVAVVATPAATVPAIVRQLGQQGVTAVVVFASGYKEAGSSSLEEEVAVAAAESDVRLCGVNCMGLVGDAPLTFSQALSHEGIPGGVSFLTQSGAVGGSLLLQAWARGLGTARFISVGNETDLAIADYLMYLAVDDLTTTVGLFIEAAADGRALRMALDTVTAAGKAVVVLRTGASEVAASAVRTHTGALAGSDAAYRQIFLEAGAAVVEDVHELVGLCQALEWQPPALGSGVAVLSTSGGGCSLVADHLARLGLDVPEFEHEVQQQLRSVLPPYAPTRNPIDTTGNITADPSLLKRVLRPAIESNRVDAVIVAISALVGESATELASGICDVAATAEKPIVVAWMVPEATVTPAFRLLRDQRIPVFDSIQLACSAVAALVTHGKQTDQNRLVVSA